MRIQARTLFREGMGSTDIAKKLGVSSYTAASWIRCIDDTTIDQDYETVAAAIRTNPNIQNKELLRLFPTIPKLRITSVQHDMLPKTETEQYPESSNDSPGPPQRDTYYSAEGIANALHISQFQACRFFNTPQKRELLNAKLVLQRGRCQTFYQLDSVLVVNPYYERHYKRATLLHEFPKGILSQRPTGVCAVVWHTYCVMLTLYKRDGWWPTYKQIGKALKAFGWQASGVLDSIEWLIKNEYIAVRNVLREGDAFYRSYWINPVNCPLSLRYDYQYIEAVDRILPVPEPYIPKPTMDDYPFPNDPPKGIVVVNGRVRTVVDIHKSGDSRREHYAESSLDFPANAPRRRR